MKCSGGGAPPREATCTTTNTIVSGGDLGVLSHDRNEFLGRHRTGLRV